MSSMLHLWLLRLRLNSPESGMVYGETFILFYFFGETFNMSFRTSSFYMYHRDCQWGEGECIHPTGICVCVRVCKGKAEIIFNIII